MLLNLLNIYEYKIKWCSKKQRIKDKENLRQIVDIV